MNKFLRPRRRDPVLKTTLALSVVVLGAAILAPAQASPPGARNAIAFNQPVRLEAYSPARSAAAGENAGEPVLEVGGTGTIYASATAVLGPAAPVWRSTDGTTFSEMESPGRLREWSLGAEGDFAVDDQGRVFFVDTYLGGMLLTRWSEEGATWDFTIPIAGVPPINDRPWLSWTPNGLFLYVNHMTEVRVYRSTDDGLTWAAGDPLTFEGSDRQQYFPGHLSADESGGTLLVAGRVTAPDGRTSLASAISRDFGATWEEARLDELGRRRLLTPFFPGISAIDDAGNAYVTWGTHDHETCAIWLAAMPVGSKKWSAPTRVNAPGGCGLMPWLDAGEKGQVALAWYEAPSTPSQAGLTGVAAPGATHRLEGDPPLSFLASAGERGPYWQVHAAMVTNATSARPRIVRSRLAEPVLMGELERQLLDFLAIAIGPDGRLHIGYSVFPGDNELPDGTQVADAYYVSSKTSFNAPGSVKEE